eukprot:SAG25_NODE_6678_length_538_cov_41.118451_2_plen_84_part_01
MVLRAPVGDTAAGGRPRVTGLAGSKLLHQNEQELQSASHTLAVLYASQPAAHPWTVSLDHLVHARCVICDLAGKCIDYPAFGHV